VRVLGIAGSPRRNGNTEILLDEALRGAKESGCDVTKLILNELEILPCQECGGCDETGICVVKDDMQKVFEEIERADFIVLSSPIFFGSLTAQAKAAIDRFQGWWIAKYILKKPRAEEQKGGFFICVGGQERLDFFNNARMIVKNFFATASIKYVGDLYYPGINKKGEIKKCPEALKESFNVGKNFCKE